MGKQFALSHRPVSVTFLPILNEKVNMHHIELAGRVKGVVDKCILPSSAQFFSIFISFLCDVYISVSFLPAVPLSRSIEEDLHAPKKGNSTPTAHCTEIKRNCCRIRAGIVETYMHFMASRKSKTLFNCFICRYGLSSLPPSPCPTCIGSAL